MELKNQPSLSNTSNKIGGVFLISVILSPIILTFIGKFLNFEFQYLNSVALFLSRLIPALFLLKIEFKKIFTQKNTRYTLRVKDYILLTVLFLSLYKLLLTINLYTTGYYLLSSTESGVTEFSNNIIFIIIQIFIAAACEEIFYRGIVLENLRKYGDVFAIIVSSIMFGLNHGTLIVFKSIAGIILGTVYVLGGNTRWAIVLHFIINATSTFLDGKLPLRFPELTTGNVDLILAVAYFIIIVVSLILISKDKNLRSLFERFKFKNIKTKIIQDKEKYKVFFSSLTITFYLLLSFFSILGIFSEYFNLYLESR